jgi:hypothetical protein
LDDQGKTALDQIYRHGFAYNSQADETYFFHDGLLWLDENLILKGVEQKITFSLGVGASRSGG